MPCLSHEKQLLGSRIRLASRDPVPNSVFLFHKAREHSRHTRGGGSREYWERKKEVVELGGNYGEMSKGHHEQEM